MFLLRSAFWLVIAFAVMAPKGVDLGATLADYKEQAISAGLQAGQDIIVSQILASETAGSAALAGLLSSPPSVDLPMQDSAKALVPFPRPRPDWMG